MTKPRSILITGVGAGLGAAFADAAVSHGYRVVGTVRNPADAQAAEARGVRAINLDLRDTSAIPGAVAAAETLVGPIEVLVNNAGHGHEGALEEAPLDALRRQLEVNLIGPVALIQAVLPGMRACRAAHIVNVTSMAGSVGLPGISYYCAAKFAMDGLSEALGKELRPLGIHVTAFSPGQFRTNWAGRSMERSPRSIPDYDGVIDPLRAARLAKSGRQPGDPAKAAAALMALIESPNPPTRLFIGPDALAFATQKVKRMQAEIGAWDQVSRATDFSPSSD